MSALDGDRLFIRRHSPEPTLLVSWKVNVDGGQSVHGVST